MPWPVQGSSPAPLGSLARRRPWRKRIGESRCCSGDRHRNRPSASVPVPLIVADQLELRYVQLVGDDQHHQGARGQEGITIASQ